MSIAQTLSSDGNDSLLTPLIEQITKRVTLTLLEDLQAERDRLSCLSYEETEAAAMIGLSAGALKHIRRQGKIDFVRSGGGKRGRVLYRRDHLIKYLEEHTVNALD